MTVKAIIELPFAPGVFTEETDRGATGRWKMADKVRFRYGLPEKFGGWEQKQPQFLGVCRNIHDWASLDGALWSAIATDWKLYLWQNETLYDITPIRRTEALTDPFSTVTGSSIVTVTDSGHGAIPNDFVTFSDAVAVGGLTLNGEFQILSVSFDSYTIDAGSNATGTASGGGAVFAEYQINTGLSSSVLANGWGVYGWGADDTTLPLGEQGWNTPRPGSGVTVAARTWSLDNWGEDLIACPFGRSIYWWDRTTGPSSRAVLLDKAPVQCNIAMISQRDRHLFAMGSTERFSGRFDPLLIRWCSTEDLNDWIPTNTNTSGDLRLYRGSKIVSAVKTRGQILVFTDQSVHSIDFLGGFDVYGVSPVGENVSILGPNAVTATDYRVYFMGEGDFFVYDGVLRVLPCAVRNYVYDRLENSQKEKVVAGLNREFNEVWWFYPGPLGYASYDVTATDWFTPYEWGFTGGTQLQWVSDSNGLSVNNSSLTNEERGWFYPDDPPDLPTEDQEVEMTLTLRDTGVFARKYTGVGIHVTGTSSADLNGYFGGVYSNGNFFFFTVFENGVARAQVNGGTGGSLQYGEQTVVQLRKNGTTVELLIDGVVRYTYDATTYNFSGGSVTPYVWLDATQSNPVASHYINSIYAGGFGEVIDQGLNGIAEITSVVVYNYEEDTWTLGELARTAWADRSEVLNKPYGAGLDGYLYQHETGVDDNGAAMAVSLQSYDAELPNAGEVLVHIDQMIPDFLTLAGSVDVYFDGKKYPQASGTITKGPYTVQADTRKLSTRIRARQVSVRVQSSNLGDDWRMGKWRARVGAHGKRG